MRNVKLKSNGSGPLVIGNASLLGRTGISVTVRAGEVKVVETEAFNPALAIEQLMKQALSRVHRGASSDSEFTWHVDCESLSFAVKASVYRPSLLTLDDPVETRSVGMHVSSDNSGVIQLEGVARNLLDRGDPNALVLVKVLGTPLSMSFRLDELNVVDKLTEIVGELTRDGTDRSRIRILVYPARIRSRRDLGDAMPVTELSLVDTFMNPPAETSLKTFRDLDLSGRYRAGLTKYLRQTDAKLLLLDWPSRYMSAGEYRALVSEIRGTIGVDRMCLIFDTAEPEKYTALPLDRMPEYDRLQLEFRRKAVKARLIDWFGIEADLAKLFSQLPDARRNGFTERDFIRNSSRYHCLSCEGEGVIRSRMGPFGEVRSGCSDCSMTGFGESILQIRFGNTSFGEVLSGNVYSLAERFISNDQIVSRIRKFCVDDLRQLKLGDSFIWVPESAIHTLFRHQIL
jgi:hypothetical protein